MKMGRLSAYDFDASWWRCKAAFSEGVIKPEDPLEAYNPFREWVGGPTREGKSLLYEFLGVNAEDTPAIVGFCERFGVLGPEEERSNFDSFVPDLHKEKKLPSQYPRWSLGGHFHQKYGGKSADPTPALEDMSVESFRARQELLRSAAKFAQEANDMSDLGKAREARERLLVLCNYKLRLVRPRLSWNEHSARWLTGWHIGSLEAAMYLMLLFDVQSPSRILTCPWCKKLFMAEHERAKFCSARCQNSHKQKMFRERLAQKEKKGSSKAKTGIKRMASRKGR
jgi:hypothetical protein